MTQRTMLVGLALLALTGAAVADHGFDHPIEGEDETCDELGVFETEDGNVLVWTGFADESGADAYAYYAIYGAIAGSGEEMILIETVDIEEDNEYEFVDTPAPPFSAQYKVRGEGSAHDGVSEPLCGYSSGLACPDVVAVRVEGGIELTWDPVEGAVSYVVFENTEIGAPPRFRQYEIVQESNATVFVDDDVLPGTPMVYIVVATDGFAEVDTTCDEIEVPGDDGDDGDEETEVPFFPAPVFAAAALVGAVGVYRVMRRK